MCALPVGLPDVTVLGVGDWPAWLRIVIATEPAPPSCCEVVAHGHGVRDVELVDLPVFGRPARLVWRKQRWRCVSCRRTWTEQNPRIASARCAMTTRAARWATLQVGRHGRTVSEVASDLDCDWHTVMDAVVIYGTPLIEDPHRFGTVPAVGLDETLFARAGPFRHQLWSTQIVDVGDAARGPPARSHHPPVAGPDRRLAPLLRQQPTDRGRQQPHQARQAGGVRHAPVPELPAASSPLRRTTQLDPARQPHPTIKSEEPDFFGEVVENHPGETPAASAISSTVSTSGPRSTARRAAAAIARRVSSVLRPLSHPNTASTECATLHGVRQGMTPYSVPTRTERSCATRSALAPRGRCRSRRSRRCWPRRSLVPTSA